MPSNKKVEQLEIYQKNSDYQKNEPELQRFNPNLLTFKGFSAPSLNVKGVLKFLKEVQDTQKIEKKQLTSIETTPALPDITSQKNSNSSPSDKKELILRPRNLTVETSNNWGGINSNHYSKEIIQIIMKLVTFTPTDLKEFSEINEILILISNVSEYYLERDSISYYFFIIFNRFLCTLPRLYEDIIKNKKKITSDSFIFIWKGILNKIDQFREGLSEEGRKFFNLNILPSLIEIIEPTVSGNIISLNSYFLNDIKKIEASLNERLRPLKEISGTNQVIGTTYPASHHMDTIKEKLGVTRSYSGSINAQMIHEWGLKGVITPEIKAITYLLIYCETQLESFPNVFAAGSCFISLVKYFLDLRFTNEEVYFHNVQASSSMQKISQGIKAIGEFSIHFDLADNTVLNIERASINKKTLYWMIIHDTWISYRNTLLYRINALINLIDDHFNIKINADILKNADSLIVIRYIIYQHLLNGINKKIINNKKPLTETEILELFELYSLIIDAFFKLLKDALHCQLSDLNIEACLTLAINIIKNFFFIENTKNIHSNLTETISKILDICNKIFNTDAKDLSYQSQLDFYQIKVLNSFMNGGENKYDSVIQIVGYYLCLEEYTLSSKWKGESQGLVLFKLIAALFFYERNNSQLSIAQSPTTFNISANTFIKTLAQDYNSFINLIKRTVVGDKKDDLTSYLNFLKQIHVFNLRLQTVLPLTILIAKVDKKIKEIEWRIARLEFYPAIEKSIGCFNTPHSFKDADYAFNQIFNQPIIKPLTFPGQEKQRLDFYRAIINNASFEPNFLFQFYTLINEIKKESTSRLTKGLILQQFDYIHRELQTMFDYSIGLNQYQSTIFLLWIKEFIMIYIEKLKSIIKLCVKNKQILLKEDKDYINENYLHFINLLNKNILQFPLANKVLTAPLNKLKKQIDSIQNYVYSLKKANPHIGIKIHPTPPITSTESNVSIQEKPTRTVHSTKSRKKVKQNRRKETRIQKPFSSNINSEMQFPSLSTTQASKHDDIHPTNIAFKKKADLSYTIKTTSIRTQESYKSILTKLNNESLKHNSRPTANSNTISTKVFEEMEKKFLLKEKKWKENISFYMRAFNFLKQFSLLVDYDPLYEEIIYLMERYLHLAAQEYIKLIRELNRLPAKLEHKLKSSRKYHDEIDNLIKEMPSPIMYKNKKLTYVGKLLYEITYIECSLSANESVSNISDEKTLEKNYLLLSYKKQLLNFILYQMKDITMYKEILPFLSLPGIPTNTPDIPIPTIHPSEYKYIEQSNLFLNEQLMSFEILANQHMQVISYIIYSKEIHYENLENLKSLLTSQLAYIENIYDEQFISQHKVLVHEYSYLLSIVNSLIIYCNLNNNNVDLISLSIEINEKIESLAKELDTRVNSLYIIVNFSDWYELLKSHYTLCCLMYIAIKRSLSEHDKWVSFPKMNSDYISPYVNHLYSNINLCTLIRHIPIDKLSLFPKPELNQPDFIGFTHTRQLSI